MKNVNSTKGMNFMKGTENKIRKRLKQLKDLRDM